MNDRTIRLHRAGAALAALVLLHAAPSFAAPSATLQGLYDFSRSAEGRGGPSGELVATGDGHYVGVTCCGGRDERGTIYSTDAQGVTRTLHALAGGEGRSPNAPLARTADGNLYGTTYEGGNNQYGTLYRLAPDGTLTVLHAFPDGDADGSSPMGGLLLASDGNLYGTTALGGKYACGTVFRISPAGEYTKLADVDTVGRQPIGALMETTDHRIVGVTEYGGQWAVGAVFGVGFDGSIQTLFSFGNVAFGAAYPGDGLIDGGDGWLYGTTTRGGSSDLGTVYRMLPDGSVMMVLHAFSAAKSKDGATPWARLARDSDGQFYGTTQGGGVAGFGVVFRVSAGSKFAKLAEFDGAGDGAYPRSGLVQVGAKKLLGAVPGGGPDGRGDTYRVDLK